MALRVPNIQSLLLLRRRSADLTAAAAAAFKSRCLSSSSSSSPLWSPDGLSNNDRRPSERRGGPNFSRDIYCNACAANSRHPPVLEALPLRSFKRELFLKATSDHAALQYLEKESQGLVWAFFFEPFVCLLQKFRSW